MSEQSWPKEPWRFDVRDDQGNLWSADDLPLLRAEDIGRGMRQILGIEWEPGVQARIAACVNACAGIADPAQEIAAKDARIAELELEVRRHRNSGMHYDD
jgi:hypothetical protein